MFLNTPSVQKYDVFFGCSNSSCHKFHKKNLEKRTIIFMTPNKLSLTHYEMYFRNLPFWCNRSWDFTLQTWSNKLKIIWYRKNWRSHIFQDWVNSFMFVCWSGQRMEWLRWVRFHIVIQMESVCWTLAALRMDHSLPKWSGGCSSNINRWRYSSGTPNAQIILQGELTGVAG